MRRCRRHNAFTLVELLVVIGIIAVLVAMLLPALNRARQQAVSIKCQSNLRQVYVAFVQYANDYKGRVPPLSQYGAPYDYSAPEWYWFKQLSKYGFLGTGQPYGGSQNGPRYPVLECPAEYGTVGPGFPGIVKMYDNPWAATSYSMNFIMNYGAWTEPAVTRLGRRTMHGFYSSTFQDGRVFDVSKVTFLMDCDTTNWGWGSAEFGYWTDYYVYTTSKYPYRHPDQRANILYFDGHIGAERHRENGGPRNWTWKYP